MHINGTQNPESLEMYINNHVLFLGIYVGKIKYTLLRKESLKINVQLLKPDEYWRTAR